MKIKFPLVTLVLLIHSFCVKTHAQHFQRALGGAFDEAPYRMINAIDGGYVIAGYTMSYGNSPGNNVDGYIVKTDNDGHIEWTKTYGTVDADQIYWIEACADSTYLFCGQTVDQITGNSLMNVAKISLTGNLIWQKNYKVGNYESGSCISMLNDGGFIVGGQCDISSDEQLMLLRCDSAGNVVWKKYFGGPDIENADEIVLTDDGGFLVIGTSRYGFYSSTLFLIKTDSVGNQMWAKTYNTSALRKTYPGRVYQLSSGGYIVSGTTTASGQPLSDVLLMRLDDTGNIIWQKIFITGEGDRAEDMLIDENANYILCGSTAISSSLGFRDALVMRIDSSGNLINAYDLGIATEDETADNLLFNDQHELIFSGFIYGQGLGETDIFIFQADKNYDSLMCNSRSLLFAEDTAALVASVYNGNWTPVVFMSNGILAESNGGMEVELCNLNSTDENSLGDFKIYPNPANNILHIISDEIDVTSVRITFYDMIGKEMKVKNVNPFSNNLEFDISDLCAGSYIVNITDKKLHFNSRFVKQ